MTKLTMKDRKLLAQVKRLTIKVQVGLTRMAWAADNLEIAILQMHAKAK